MCICDTDEIMTKYIRMGRAHFICPECSKDVTIRVCLMYDAIENRDTTLKQLNKEIQNGKKNIQKSRKKSNKKVK